MSSTHARLDHEHCIETVVLRSRTAAVRTLAESVMAQPGVSHGNLHLVPMATRHAHGDEHLEPAVAPPTRQR